MTSNPVVSGPLAVQGARTVAQAQSSEQPHHNEASGGRRDWLAGASGYGAGAMRLSSMLVVDDAGKDIDTVRCGDAAIFTIAARAEVDVSLPNLGVSIFAEDGSLIYAVSLKNLNAQPSLARKNSMVESAIRIVCDLAPGSYQVTVIAGDNHASSSGDSGVHHDTREGLGPLVVVADPEKIDFEGMIRLPFVVDVLG